MCGVAITYTHLNTTSTPQFHTISANFLIPTWLISRKSFWSFLKEMCDEQYNTPFVKCQNGQFSVCHVLYYLCPFPPYSPMAATMHCTTARPVEWGETHKRRPEIWLQCFIFSFSSSRSFIPRSIILSCKLRPASGEEYNERWERIRCWRHTSTRCVAFSSSSPHIHR